MSINSTHYFSYNNFSKNKNNKKKSKDFSNLESLFQKKLENFIEESWYKNNTLINVSYENQKNKDSIAYLLNILGRQIAGPTVKALSSIYAIFGKFQTISAKYADNPSKKMFTDHAIFTKTFLKNLYNPNTPLGKAMAKLLLPNKYKNGIHTKEAAIAIKAHGAKVTSFASYGNAGSNAVRLLTNLLSISNDFDKASTLEKAIVSFDTSTVASNLTYDILLRKGLSEISKDITEYENKEIIANRFLKYSKKVNIISGIFALLAGVSRIINELSREKIHPSSLLAGSMDIGKGGISILFSNYYLQAANELKIVSESNQVLMGMVHWPKFLTYASRIFGSIGAAVGITNNSHGLYKAVTNETISKHQKNDKLISHILGLSGSLLILVGVLLFTPVTVTVCSIFYLAGTTLLILQTIHDYKNELGELFDKTKNELSKIFQKIQSDFAEMIQEITEQLDKTKAKNEVENGKVIELRNL